MKVNQRIHGFILQREEKIDEINGIARIFQHEKTGARLIYLSNEDRNKVFQIGFRTPSNNSTGVAHIMEHSVLCGSRKYPLKEPFVELLKGSLNTFLNAMTYPDKTVYPIASTNDKDFMNLMDVYLDAVFYPAIYENQNIFRQEGWHYHIEKPEDPIIYNGVVYNEMKGVYSNPEEYLQNVLFSTLFPDSIYGKDSGGNPDEIPELSYEDYCAFHKRYYHPSNAYIYFYGNGDVEEHLQYLDEAYLSHFDKAKIDSSIKTQPKLEKMAEKALPYPVSEEDDLENRDYLSIGYVMDPVLPYMDVLSLDILCHILLGSDTAPLKKAIMDLNICEEVAYDFQTPLKQTTLNITLKNTNQKHKALVIKTIDETLEKLVKEGLNKKSIEAAININEFSMSEGEYGAIPTGLMLGLEMLDNWLYDADPLSSLKYKQLYKDIRKAADEQGFEEMILHYFLNNTHRASVVIYPDKQIASTHAKAQAEKLAAFKASLSPEALTELVAETQNLLERQNEIDSPEALETIPRLSIDEISPKTREGALKMEQFMDRPLLFHPGKTNDVVYLKFYFDVRTIAQEDLQYLSILQRFLGKLETEDYSSERLRQEIEIYTGGIGNSLEIYDHVNQIDEYTFMLTVKSKAMIHQMPHLIKLLDSMLFHTKFEDKKMMKNILTAYKTNKAKDFLSNGHAISIQRLQSGYSQAGMAFEKIGGIEFYRFITECLKDFDTSFEAFAEKMKRLTQTIFDRSHMQISLTCDDHHKDQALRWVAELINHVPEKATPEHTYHFNLVKESEGFMTTSKVQYVSKGENIRQYGYTYNGTMAVLKAIMGTDYLWNNVRVQGGAYGAFYGINASGDLYMSSYRDPNLVKTLKAYDQAADYVKNIDISQREIEKYIIGTISSKDVPISDGAWATVMDTYYFKGLTDEDRQKEREDILKVTIDDIRKQGEMIEKVMKDAILCTIGNEEKIKESAKLFTKTEYLN